MPKNRRKLFVRVLRIIGIFLIVLAAFFIGINYLANKKLPELLGDGVKVESFEIFVWDREIHFEKPILVIDSTSTDSGILIQSAASRIDIVGFSFWDLLVSSKVGVQQLIIDSLKVAIRIPEFRPSNPDRKDINFFVKEIFTSIEVTQFELLQAGLLVQERDSLDTLVEVTNLRLSARNVVVDTSTVNRMFPLEFSESHLQMDSFRLRISDLYELYGGNLSIRDTTLKIRDLHFTSPYRHPEFTSRLDYEKAQLDLKVAELTCKNLLWQIDEERNLSLTSPHTDLDRVRLLVYKDKRPPRQPLQVKPLLINLIRELPFTLTLDTLTLRDSYIAYEQLPVAFPQSGKLWFDQLYMTGYHVSNDTIEIQKRPWTVLDTESRFMSKGALQVVFRLNMASPQQAFAVKGRLGTLPISYVNEVLTPLVGVTAEGTVNELKFDFRGDQYDSEGTLDFDYSDLKISIFKDNRDKSWLKSTFGNLLLKNSNNKDSGVKYKKGEIYFIRYQNKDFFNFLWNSLQVGLMDVVIPFYTNPDKVNPPANEPKYQLED